MQAASYRFQLLAPSGASTAAFSGQMLTASDTHDRYLGSLQQLRARAYLEDGAIQSREIDEAGRFRMHQDEQCWHFLLIDCEDRVVGCVRYLVHPKNASFDNLWISQSPLAKDRVWGPKLRGAVEADLAWTRERDLSFIEVGGWAIDAEYRHTKAALEVMLASFAWAQLVGAGVGCCTATFRNQSASILRRIGGASFEFQGEALHPYEDATYGCKMEVLRFHFQAYDSRYRKLVNYIHGELAARSTVVRPNPVSTDVGETLSTAENLEALHLALAHARQKAPLFATV